MLSADDEALVGQREGALLAVEAVLVPGVALVVHHVGAVAEPCRDETDRQKDIETCLVLIVPVICPNVQHKLVSNDEKQILFQVCGQFTVFKVAVRTK